MVHTQEGKAGRPDGSARHYKVGKSLTLTSILKGNFESLIRLNNVSLGREKHTPGNQSNHLLAVR